MRRYKFAGQLSSVWRVVCCVVTSNLCSRELSSRSHCLNSQSRWRRRAHPVLSAGLPPPAGKYQTFLTLIFLYSLGWLLTQLSHMSLHLSQFLISLLDVIFSPLESVHQRLLIMHFIDFKTNILAISYHVLCAANTRHSRHHNVTC